MNSKRLKVVLEEIKQFLEATYSRDAENRRIAEKFYKDLYDYLKVDDAVLMKRLREVGNGSFAVFSTDFSDIPNRFIVRFDPVSGKALKGGVGKTSSGIKVIVLPVLLGPGDIRYLATRLNHDVVVHEVIHLLDPGFGKEKKGYSSKVASGETETEDWDKYYNDPAEWNAYWQEGAAQFERLLRNKAISENPAARSAFFGDGSLKQVLARASRFWDKGFIEHMNSKVRRKFNKRLADLWSNLKEQGLFEKEDEKA